MLPGGTRVLWASEALFSQDWVLRSTQARLNVLQLDTGVVAEGRCRSVGHREAAPWTSVCAKMRSYQVLIHLLSPAFWLLCTHLIASLTFFL